MTSSSPHDPTIDDLARACGVSKGTVSKALSARALGNRLSAETQERIRRMATEMGYIADRQSRMRARKRSGYIALTYGGYAPITYGVYEDVPELAALSAMGHGYQLVFVPGQGGRRAWSRMLCDHRIDGCLIVEGAEGMEQFFVEESVPAVVLNDAGEGLLRRVLADEVAGTMQMVDHLLALGHQRIAFAHFGGGSHFKTSIRHYSYGQRLATFRQRVTEAGGIAIERIDEPVDTTITRLLQCREERETAIICECHQDAQLLLSACHEARISIPEDLSIACLDYVSAMDWAVPRLTAMHVPLAEMTKLAIHLIIQQITGDEPLTHTADLCSPTLKVGLSTAPPAFPRSK